jgi:hypothetical protein
MIQYNGDLKRKWEESSQYQAPTTDPTIIKEREHELLYQFLSGLDEPYEQMRAQILFLSELPTLEDAMARLQGEESRRELMGGSSVAQERPERAAMISNRSNLSSQPKGYKKGQKCDHCKRDGNDKTKCWHLHPELRPSWWKEEGESGRNFKGEKRKGFEATRIQREEMRTQRGDELRVIAEEKKGGGRVMG